jgi:prevent-host-death family protein
VENPNHKGNVAELAIAAEAARLGLSVLKPLTEHERYDLVLGIGGRLLRIQSKWGASDGKTIQVRLTSSYHSPTRGYVTRTYGKDEIDAVAVYCEATGKSYLVPIEAVAGLGLLTLRLAPARNNQRAALNFAARYEFPGAVAQLEERVAGSDEVRGSSPLSSMQEPDVPGRVSVGAHEFRNRFGYYLENAAAGAEIFISRHGRPYARLGPAVLNPAVPVSTDDDAHRVGSSNSAPLPGAPPS